MIHLLISIIGIVITLLFIIGTHEWAHFAAARLLGVKVLRFSIGFGSTLCHWYDKKGTEYVIAAIPLGGYVKMLDEGEEKVPPNELQYAFNRQPFYKKFLIVAAGPTMNVICALLLYWVIFMIGFVTIRPVIGTVMPNSIAAQGGLKTNQEIVSIDAKPAETWMSILFNVLTHTGNQDQLKINVKNVGTKKTESHVLDLTHWKMNALNPDPLAALGIAPYEPNIPLVVGFIQPNSPAASHLKIGDKIKAINNAAVKNWEELINTVLKHADETVIFTLERSNKSFNLTITLSHQRDWLGRKSGYLGMGPVFKWPENLLHKIQYGPLTAMSHAWNQVVQLTYFNLLLFGKMITGKLSLQSLGGPITIFQSAGNALNSGFLSFLSFLAFLSISIGIINFLPIPGLDGGHLFLQIIEFIIRRSIPEQVMGVLLRLGFALILFVLIQAVVNDVLRL